VFHKINEMTKMLLMAKRQTDKHDVNLLAVYLTMLLLPLNIQRPMLG
jgi:hypothetical protein